MMTHKAELSFESFMETIEVYRKAEQDWNALSYAEQVAIEDAAKERHLMRTIEVMILSFELQGMTRSQAIERVEEIHPDLKGMAS